VQPIGHAIVRLDSVPSTNTLVLGREDYLSRHGLVVIARHQTAGRGRLGRVWASLPGAQLQFSVVIHPRLPLAEVPVVALVAGLAVAQALVEALALRPRLKWPNDVLLGGRKVCGILAESKADASGAPRLVVGIGVNCGGTAGDFPPELRGTVTTLAEAGGRPVDNEAVLQAILRRLEALLARVEGGEKAGVLADWSALADSVGRRVRFPTPAGPVEGTIAGLTPDGALLAQDDAGRSHVLVSSELEWLG
jgi:BirA family biotin operon repressor/biotin-[acetyl-CoA-carboxylase] ligase